MRVIKLNKRYNLCKIWGYNRAIIFRHWVDGDVEKRNEIFDMLQKNFINRRDIGWKYEWYPRVSRIAINDDDIFNWVLLNYF